MSFYKILPLSCTHLLRGTHFIWYWCTLKNMVVLLWKVIIALLTTSLIWYRKRFWELIFFSSLLTKFRNERAFWTKLRDHKQTARSHRRNLSISILLLPSNGFCKIMRFFETVKWKEGKMSSRNMYRLIHYYLFYDWFSVVWRTTLITLVIYFHPFSEMMS